MSGPKVVSIVSREEVIEICQVLLAQVDAEIAEWTRVGLRHSLISMEEESSVRKSRALLTQLFDAGQFLSLQKKRRHLFIDCGRIWRSVLSVQKTLVSARLADLLNSVFSKISTSKGRNDWC